MLNLIYLIRTDSPFLKDSLASLHRIKMPMHFIAIEERRHRWAAAVRQGLSRIDNGPVLIMEEDVVIPETTEIDISTFPDDKTLYSGLLLTKKNYVGHGGANINTLNQSLKLIEGNYEDLQDEYPKEVDIISGSFLWLPESAWQSTSPADLPGLGWEDIFWLLELRKKGYKTVVQPIKLFHFCQVVQRRTPGVDERINLNWQIVQRRLFAS
jgi:GT2 family glycosyltransferase